ncbi:uncharacterized protein LOC112589067 isoform X1 [Harpegnathos saltator]|uniref:uncharacterized protein LOC105190413 isoform X1 n=1 Tax=Harpegnathos saltator TaxID=610380 RepID=UPI000DBEF16F|nr:uncharacterized protein LOC105190413 isoform X1 [Harpegnathos saltator]XP_025156718.1 uncharacterized protein LOC105190413 isoform X1 [Harpegnathos saltator]XP_025156721.1 uncharacterized protein LOC112589067 isoform X1 [Harpegnathos saltator]XP_025156722.1 uncharacterized protein LOC112589067 isoform X1 [Harpegnathos saltator]
MDFGYNNIMELLSPPPGWRDNWAQPLNVYALRKKVADPPAQGGVKYVDTNTIVAVFPNITLPNYSLLIGKRIYMIPFIQRVIRCLHCQRFGHSIRVCRGRRSPITCARCTGSGHSDDECSSKKIKCINCLRLKREDKDLMHKASDVKCPVFLEQKLKKIMATFCLSPGEADMFLRDKGPIPLGFRKTSLILERILCWPQRRLATSSLVALFPRQKIESLL